MEVSDVKDLHSFEQFQFEEQEKSWDLLLLMISSRT